MDAELEADAAILLELTRHPGWRRFCIWVERWQDGVLREAILSPAAEHDLHKGRYRASQEILMIPENVIKQAERERLYAGRQ